MKKRLLVVDFETFLQIKTDLVEKIVNLLTQNYVILK